MVDVERRVRINVIVSTRSAKRALDDVRHSLEEHVSVIDILRDRNRKAGEALRDAFRRAFHAATTFREELLSLLFGTMAINMTLGAVVGRIADLMGASEAWNLIWTALLWDVVEPLVDLLWWIAEIIDGLPGPLRGFIGVVLVAIVLVAQLGFLVAMVWQTMIAFFGPRGAGIIPILGKVRDALAAVFQRLKELGAAKVAGKIFGVFAWFVGVLKGLPKLLWKAVGAVAGFLKYVGSVMVHLVRLFFTVGKVGALAFAAVLYVLQYVLRFGFDLRRVIAMIVVDLLYLFRAVLDGASLLVNALLTPLRAVGLRVPTFDFGAPVAHWILAVKRWGGVEGEQSLVEQARTTVNVFVDRLIGKDPETLRDELDTVVRTSAGGMFTSVDVG